MGERKLVKLEYKNGCWYATPQPFREDANLEVVFNEDGKIVEAKVIEDEEE